ncbi:unnamed protein product, partial [Staurois parvus]
MLKKSLDSIGNWKSLKKKFKTQTLIIAICRVYKRFAFETLIKSTAECKFS